METNRQHYGITHSDYVYIHDYDPRCPIGECSNCRHGDGNCDSSRYDSCYESWLDAPYEQPLDLREPWNPEPEPDPNPL